MQFAEDTDLGSQKLRNYGNRNVVAGAALIAFHAIKIRQVNRRDEENRQILKAGMLANQVGEFEPVEFGHADIEQDDGKIGLKQLFEGFFAGADFDEIFAEF